MAHLEPDQIAALTSKASSPRYRLMLIMTYEHGLRVSETLALTPDRVKNGFLCTKPGKKGKLTIQRMEPSTLVLWNEVSKNLAPSTRLFPFTRQWASEIFHRSCDAAGIMLVPRQGIHTLRHSTAHHLLDSGAPLPVVQRKLGHVSLGSTGRYLLPSDNDVDTWSHKALAICEGPPREEKD